MLDKTVGHLVQREPNILQADFLADDIERHGREAVVHVAHDTREHGAIADAGVENAHGGRARMDVGELEPDAGCDLPLFRAGVHEQEVFLPVVEETEITFRIAAGRRRRRRRRRRRYRPYVLHGWRVEEHAPPPRPRVGIARHEGADALERVGGNATAVAKAACQFAVIDGAPTESRLGESARPAKFGDFLQDLFVYDESLAAFPDCGSQRPLAESEPKFRYAGQ